MTIVPNKGTTAHIRFSDDGVYDIMEVVDRRGEIQLFYVDDDFRQQLINALQKQTNYTRPELTEEEKKDATTEAFKLVRTRGMRNLPIMFVGLCVENIRLVKEINDHRAARGITPLEVHKV